MHRRFQLAGVIAVIGMSVSGVGMFIGSFSGMVYPDVQLRVLDQAGQEQTAFIRMVNDAALVSTRVGPVVQALAEEIEATAACEVATSCLSRQGIGGRGEMAISLEGFAAQARSIVTAFERGAFEREELLADLNDLNRAYQEILADTDRSITERRAALQEAFEGYASGRFETQVEVKRFLERQPSFPKDLPGGEIRNQRIYDMLTRVIYAGYIEAPKWNIPLRKAQHEALISFETFEKIQARLKGTAKAPARKDISEDFPLRGFVLCNDCQKPLTACWSQGKKQKYPYYLCPTKGCTSYRKSIKRDELEGEFEGLLHGLEPSQGLFALVKAMFSDAWNARLAQSSQTSNEIKKSIKQLEKQIDQLLDRIVEASNGSVVTAYEKRIAKLEREKILAQEQLAQNGKPRHTFEESFEHAMSFLSSPWDIWINSDLALKKTVLRLAFVEPLPYCRKQGLRTPKLTLPFKALGDIFSKKCEMAHLEGETSNTLFEALEEWERHLAQLDRKGPRCDDEHFRP